MTTLRNGIAALWFCSLSDLAAAAVLRFVFSGFAAR